MTARHSQSNHLTFYTRMHSGVEPYQCATCEWSFPHNAALKSHVCVPCGKKITVENSGICGSRSASGAGSATLFSSFVCSRPTTEQPHNEIITVSGLDQ